MNFTVCSQRRCPCFRLFRHCGCQHDRFGYMNLIFCVGPCSRWLQNLSVGSGILRHGCMSEWVENGSLFCQQWYSGYITPLRTRHSIPLPSDLWTSFGSVVTTYSQQCTFSQASYMGVLSGIFLLCKLQDMYLCCARRGYSMGLWGHNFDSRKIIQRSPESNERELRAIIAILWWNSSVMYSCKQAIAQVREIEYACIAKP